MHMGLLDFSWIGMFMILGLALFLFNQVMVALGQDTGFFQQIIFAIAVFFAGFCVYYIYHVIFKRGQQVGA